MQPIIDDLNWRYAVKQFDAKRKLSPKEIEFLSESLRLTATSYGLMPFKLLIIDEPETKTRLKDASYGQSQVADASHVLILCNRVKPGKADVDAYMKLVSEVREVPLEKLNGFSERIISKLEKMDRIAEWTAKQAYIALGNLLTVCAVRRIDACPMEGFEAEKYNEILGLNELGLNACLAVPVGYRSKADKTQFLKKVRPDKKDFVINR